MQNAAFAAAGLDWYYAAFDVEDPLAAVAALRTLGFAGTNVTIPHKRAVVAVCDEADGQAVNTLVFRDGRVLGFNTDKEILAGINATPVRDEVLVEPRAGQTVVDLAYSGRDERPAARSSTGSRRSCARARSRSSSGRACRLRPA